jgi:anti-sigma factor RsiW
LIEAHFDGELDLSQQVLVREHLEGCADCSAAYGELARQRGDIRSQPLYYHAPESIHRRVTALLREADRVQPVQRLWPWRWTAVAASIILTVSLGANLALMVARRTESHLIAQEAMSGHVRAMLSSHLMDVVSSDRHTVKPWFGDKLDFSPDVKDLAGQGFPLSGGRVDYLDGRPVAALVFRRAQHVITLFTWPSGLSRTDEVSQRGFHVVAWTKEGMAYWAVSDLNVSELKRFASLYQN